MISWKAAIEYPEQFNRDQILIKKSLAIKADQSQEEIKEVDSEHEETDGNKSETQSQDIVRKSSEIQPIIFDKDTEVSISKHVGSIEEFLTDKLLIEQGQVHFEEYQFFCNVYFRKFKLDYIENCKF